MAKKITQLILLLALILLSFKGIANATVLLLPEKDQNIDGGKAAQEIIKLTNLYRQNTNLTPLTINPRLTQAALNKAKSLLAEQYFAHTSPQGKKFSDWIKEVNYNYFYIGENLAIDFATPQEVFDAWLASPKHKENLDRGEFQEIGVAYVKGKFQGRQTNIVVQLFGSRVLGVNELTGNGEYNAIADNYFGSSPNKIRANILTLNYYLDLSLLLLFLLSLPFVFAWGHRSVLTTSGNTTSPVTPLLKQFGNKQKYSMSDDSNILTINQSPSNQRRKPRQYQPAIDANQVHRR